MLRKKIAVLVGLMFILGVVLGASATAFAGPIKLTFSDLFPPTHIQSKLYQAWCAEVEKRTKGAVVVEYFPGQTLTKAKQIYDGVVQGLSDMGACLFGYTRGRFQLLEAVDLPLGYVSGSQATQVVNMMANKFKPKELSDVKVMYLHAHGPGLLHTRKKPVASMADLKGLKIRSHGTTAKVVKALGGTPVAMPMPELYPSLQKGVVDGALYPLEVNKGWKMGEVIGNVTLSYSMAYTSSFFVVMNKDKWAQIPPEAQKAIEAINKEWIPKHGAAWNKSDDIGRELMKSKGRKFVKLADAEAAKWKEVVQPVIAEYIKDVEAKGMPAGEVVEFVKKAMAEAK